MAEPGNRQVSGQVGGHVSADDLADAALGLVPDARAVEIAEHLRICSACSARAEELAAVERMLAAVPTPVMPAAVAARLDGVIAAEQQRRDAFRPTTPLATPVPPRVVEPTQPRPSLGTLPPPRSPWSQIVRTALVAAVAAVLVGFGGYVVSASAGLGGPIRTAAVQVSSADLAGQARDLAGVDNLKAYVFSPSWWCANRVVSGRITGLAPAVVDGTPALLVYTTADAVRTVSVVTGCPESGVVQTSAVLGR